MRLFAGVSWVSLVLVAGVAGCGAGAGGQTGVSEVVVPAVPAASPAASAAQAAEAKAEEGEAAEPIDEEAGEEAAEFGMIGLLNAGAGGDPNAPTAPWARDESLDGPWAKGGVFGAGVGDSGAAWGTVLGAPVKLASGVTLGAPHVEGRLPAEVIARIARANLGRYRLCYENGLRSNPNLQGRVRVRFVIGRDGAVSAVSNGGSDLADAAVIACVVRSFYGLSFPMPEGGVVTVLYPISFAPGSPSAAPAAAPAPAPAAPTATPSAAPAPTP